MSAYAVTRLAWDLEHVAGLGGELRADPDAVLGRYQLTPAEREAVTGRDPAALLGAGVNPVVVRNLIVLLRAPGSEMYLRSHD